MFKTSEKRATEIEFLKEYWELNLIDLKKKLIHSKKRLYYIMLMIVQDWVPFDNQEDTLQYHKLPPDV